MSTKINYLAAVHSVLVVVVVVVFLFFKFLLFDRISTSSLNFRKALDLTTINSVIFGKIASCKRHHGGGEGIEVSGNRRSTKWGRIVLTAKSH